MVAKFKEDLKEKQRLEKIAQEEKKRLAAEALAKLTHEKEVQAEAQRKEKERLKEELRLKKLHDEAMA